VEDLVKLQIRNVPVEWHKALKHIATDRRISLNALLLEMIEKTAQGGKKDA
jgi:predicted HicB family RNase H-like nuclease